MPGPLFTLRILAFYFFCIIISNCYTSISSASQSQKQIFPTYQVIEDNVKFWEDIYATYSVNQAVIHDTSDLSKIYGVINLLEEDTPDTVRRNSETLKKERQRYAELLKNLSVHPPVTEQEKKMAALFQGADKKLQMAAAADNIRSQRGLREKFSKGVILSGSHMIEIKRILKGYNLPEALAYLPHVESSFNTRAHSKFGAAGIWQFTRTTGKQYLTINSNLDERFDPILSTHAAAKYLKNSYRDLGDWPLAITSYNYGLSGMLRAKKEQGDYENIFQHYRKGHFKFAARNFYSEFLAALNAAQQLENEIQDQIYPPNKNRYLKLPGFIQLTALAKHFRMPVDELVQLNPALRKPVINGEQLVPKGYTLRLPAEKDTNLRIANLPSSEFRKNQLKYPFHRVQRGETASGIAKKYKVSLTDLIKTNKLDSSATVYFKQKLKIPGLNNSVSASKGAVFIKKTHEKSMINSSILTLSNTKKRLPSEKESESIPRKDPTVYNVFGLKADGEKRVGYITVQPEETVSQYAEWLNSDIKTIMSLNNLSSDASIGPGDQLLLPFDNQHPTDFEDKRLDFLEETEEGFFSSFTVVGHKIYQVNDGDTFWDICYKKFEIPFWLLERYNLTVNLQKLMRDQKLVIPLIQQI